MRKKNAENEPIFYVVVQWDKRGMSHTDDQDKQFERERSYPDGSSEEKDRIESWIWSIKQLYGSETLSELREEVSAKFLCSGQYQLQISEIGLALERFKVWEEGIKMLLVISQRDLLVINICYRRKVRWWFRVKSFRHTIRDRKIVKETRKISASFS